MFLQDLAPLPKDKRYSKVLGMLPFNYKNVLKKKKASQSSDLKSNVCHLPILYSSPSGHPTHLGTSPGWKMKKAGLNEPCL
jgi:hypothetical protein